MWMKKMTSLSTCLLHVSSAELLSFTVEGTRCRFEALTWSGRVAVGLKDAFCMDVAADPFPKHQKLLGQFRGVAVVDGGASLKGRMRSLRAPASASSFSSSFANLRTAATFPILCDHAHLKSSLKSSILFFAASPRLNFFSIARRASSCLRSCIF